MITEAPRYSPIPDFSELAPKRETERQNIGVALMIIADDPRSDNGRGPLIWTIKEMNSKKQTEKQIGQISIPAETRKLGESDASNIRGALAEFCDDNLLVSSSNITITDGSLYRDALNLNGHFVADLLVVVFDGSIDFPISPANRDEVEPNGWMHLEEIKESDSVRPFLKQFIENGQAVIVTQDALRSHRASPERRVSLIPQRFSINEFYLKREEIKDVPLEI